MFTAYIKYISLLLFSGLILTFYCINAPVATVGTKRFSVFSVIECAEHKAAFSFFNDIILPLFPALSKV